MAAQQTTFTLEAMQFFGRLGGDYEAMFGLSLASLAGKRVLDCPSGPSSFVAELHALGVDAVGVDPLYAESRATLVARGVADAEGKPAFGAVVDPATVTGLIDVQFVQGSIAALTPSTVLVSAVCSACAISSSCRLAEPSATRRSVRASCSSCA